MTSHIRKPARRLGLGLLVGLAVGTFAVLGGGAAVAGTPPVTEKVLFEWTAPITMAERGFPRFFKTKKYTHPSTALKLVKAPLNFAEGTLYFRVMINDQPTVQTMYWQYCAWQDNFYRENCTYSRQDGTKKQLLMLPGEGTRVITWSEPIAKMWKMAKRPIDWSRPRQAHGFAIMLPNGKNVSDYFKSNLWAGQNPEAWYPMNTTGGSLMAVIVAKGATFGGWENYP